MAVWVAERPTSEKSFLPWPEGTAPLDYSVIISYHSCRLCYYNRADEEVYIAQSRDWREIDFCPATTEVGYAG